MNYRLLQHINYILRHGIDGVFTIMTSGSKSITRIIISAKYSNYSSSKLKKMLGEAL